MEPAASFEELAGNTAFEEPLKEIYKDVNQVPGAPWGGS
jgi:hypothetical protein